MKKLAIGCGVIVVLLGVIAVGVGYYGYLKVKGTVTQFAELRKLPDIEREVRVRTPFTPPASGELTPAQVDRLLLVQRRVHDRLGENFARFQRTYQSLADKKQATVVDFPALMSAYRDLAAMWLDAKRTQVAALNEAGLSLDEYRWIRSSAYQAIGAPFVDVDFAKLADEAKAGIENDMSGSFEGAFKGQAPAGNVKLVEKFKKQLQDNLALASFGL